jgi:hypothetical protein
MEIPYLRNYCLIGLSDYPNEIEELKEDLTIISETDINFVSGDFLIIATFSSAFTATEINELLSMSEKSFIVFEMMPGFFTANFKNKDHQNSLFGGEIDSTKNPFINLEETISKFKDQIKGDIKDTIIPDILNFANEIFITEVEEEKSYEELLKDALKNENYEEAAKLRDKINKNK